MGVLIPDDAARPRAGVEADDNVEPAVAVDIGQSFLQRRCPGCWVDDDLGEIERRLRGQKRQREQPPRLEMFDAGQSAARGMFFGASLHA